MACFGLQRCFSRNSRTSSHVILKVFDTSSQIAFNICKVYLVDNFLLKVIIKMTVDFIQNGRDKNSPGIPCKPR